MLGPVVVGFWSGTFKQQKWVVPLLGAQLWVDIILAAVRGICVPQLEGYHERGLLNRALRGSVED